MCLTQHFSTFFVQGLANGFLYALIALGYTLVYGVLQLINFAHSEVFMAGGFGGMFLLSHLVHGQPHGVMSVLIVIAGLVGGGIAGAVTAFVLETGRLSTAATAQRTEAGLSSSAPSARPSSC